MVSHERAIRRAGRRITWSCLAEAVFPWVLTCLKQELAKGYGMLFLCNLGNPTGRLYPPDEVTALIQMCREAGTFVVIDEAFMDFCEESSVKQTVMAGAAGWCCVP